MEPREYSTDLNSFIDNVLLPSEAFARLCIDSTNGVHISSIVQGRFEDFGVVLGALAFLSKQQLLDFSAKLQSQVGDIEVTSPASMYTTTDVCSVLVKSPKR